jgi:hypothetical protein
MTFSITTFIPQNLFLPSLPPSLLPYLILWETLHRAIDNPFYEPLLCCRAGTIHRRDHKEQAIMS